MCTTWINILIIVSLLANIDWCTKFIHGYMANHEHLFSDNSKFLDSTEKEAAAPKVWQWSKLALRDYLRKLTKLSRGITVDSGAADSVFPAKWIRRTLVRPSAGSKSGLHYVAASGNRLANLGEFMLNFVCRDGTKAGITFQVADVNKPLASVSHLTDEGYRVVFDKFNGKDISFIQHKATKQIIKLQRERGVYLIDTFLVNEIHPKNENDSAAGSINTGFSRQG